MSWPITLVREHISCRPMYVPARPRYKKKLSMRSFYQRDSGFLSLHLNVVKFNQILLSNCHLRAPHPPHHRPGLCDIYLRFRKIVDQAELITLLTMRLRHFNCYFISLLKDEQSEDYTLEHTQPGQISTINFIKTLLQL